EEPHLAAVPAQEPAGLFGQQARTGADAQRAVEDEDARRVRRITGRGERFDLDRIEPRQLDIRQIDSDRLGHADAPPVVTTSPSSLVNEATGLSSSPSTTSDGRHSATPRSVTTIGLLMRTGWASIASTSSPSVSSGLSSPSSS